MYFTWKQSVLATYLPGLSNAESSRSGRLVAPITNTSQDLLRPSNSAKSWETTRSMTPPESPDLPRLGASESNSSKKMTQGVALLALSNTVTRCTCINYVTVTAGEKGYGKNSGKFSALLAICDMYRMHVLWKTQLHNTGCCWTTCMS